MVVYPIDIHSVWASDWKEGTIEKRNSVRRTMITNFGFGPPIYTVCNFFPQFFFGFVHLMILVPRVDGKTKQN